MPARTFKSVDIPSEVTLIDRSAFENAGIETIVIPDSVKEIGDYAFENAPLTSVSFGKMSKVRQPRVLGLQ